jgi:outer membrane scaffolding protein for murein synthesis (MipA/OmpV family)
LRLLPSTVFVLTSIVVMATTLPARAAGQDVELNFSGKPVYIESEEIEGDRKRDSWSGQLGLGLSLAPRFLGASDHDVFGTLQFRGSFRDKIFIENNRIGGVLHSSRFLKFGVLGRLDLGRQGDLTLAEATGAQEVEDTLEIGVFAATSLYKLFLSAELYAGVSGVHRGVNVELEAGYTFELNSSLKVTPILGMNWGSDDFNDAFFGIHSGALGFEDYDAKAGIYEVYSEVSAEQRLAKSWLVKASVRGGLLMNSAGRSPIVKSNRGARGQVTAYLGLVWLF